MKKKSALQSLNITTAFLGGLTLVYLLYKIIVGQTENIWLLIVVLCCCILPELVKPSTKNSEQSEQEDKKR